MAQSKSSAVGGLKALLWCSFVLTTTTTITAFDRPQAQVLDAATKATLMPRERYVASNRFAVKLNKAAKFEKRWATRKSRLAELDGFKYFHLMRRVALGEKEGETPEEEKDVFGNYVSFTVWDEKENFDDWRKGDAFKEAHGGTSIVSFLSTMINSARVMNGPPRPAFYDALLVQSKPPENMPQLVDGWRDVEADGVNLLPTECFVACNQFFVPPENMAAFEQRWANRKSQLMDCDGFCSFLMLRRDGLGKGETNEPSFVSTTVWKDRAAFDNWRTGKAFQQAHGSKEGASGERPKPMWSKPPEPIFYEGALVITTADGA